MLDEECVLTWLSAAELYACVDALLTSDQERLVVYERFVLDVSPRRIQQRHPDLFSTVSLLFTTRRNVCERLRRHPAIQAFYLEQGIACAPAE